jgi:hypothetical protein
MSLKSYLELKIAWKDEHCIALNISASNTNFMGSTKVYDSPTELLKFASNKLVFPNENKIVFYELGNKDNSYFSMHFYQMNENGHVSVRIYIHQNNMINHNHRINEKVEMEIMVELSGIDRFQQELITMATKQEGIATLFGRDNNPDI